MLYHVSLYACLIKFYRYIFIISLRHIYSTIISLDVHKNFVEQNYSCKNSTPVSLCAWLNMNRLLMISVICLNSLSTLIRPYILNAENYFARLFPSLCNFLQSRTCYISRRNKSIISMYHA